MLCLFANGYTWCQTAIPTDPKPALHTAFEKGNLMVALSGREWRPGLNMAVASLETGQSISLNIHLEANTAYTFIASNAGGPGDIDLYLRDPAGQILEEDREDDNTPIIEYQISKAGEYQLQLHLVSAQFQREFIALTILQAGGVSISEQEYQQVSNAFFGAAEEIMATEAAAGWQRQPYQWCAYGYVVGDNTGVTLQKLRPKEGKIFFAASGSPLLQNIDLYLASENQRIVAADMGPDAYPLISYDCPANTSFDLRVEVERAKKPAFLLVGVFEQ